MYDYCIVGAGPSGLCLAFLLSKKNHKILLIEREHEIGGCHRVRRENKVFTEHGPRIYSTSYVNTMSWFEMMQLKFYDYFQSYNFTITNIAGSTVSSLHYNELYSLFLAYIKFILDPNFGKKKDVTSFMKENNFSKHSSDYIDRLCRLTDGSGSDRYTLYELLQLVNQNFFATLLQPNIANDKGFLPDIQKVLEGNNVDFMLNTKIEGVEEDNGKINKLFLKKEHNVISFDSFSNVVFATPLPNLKTIFKNKHIGVSHDYIKNTQYNTYISITFHWKKEINVKDIHGFPESDWKIAFIILSNYFDMKSEEYKTLISTTITMPNAYSHYLKKHVNECNEEELKKEVFRQINEKLDIKKNYDLSLLSPGVFLNEHLDYNCKDVAYMRTKESYPVPFRIPNLKNAYTLGTHNLKHKYEFTSMESAVSNAFAFYNFLEKDNVMDIKSPLTLNYFIKFIIIVLFLYKFMSLLVM